MSKTIAIVGAKGGTAKSSSAAALGHLYAAAGLDVLLVDADPQGSLTRRFALRRAATPLAAPPVALTLDGMAEDAGSLSLLPGGRALEAADEHRITAHLERAASLGTDLVLVDTPPALGPIVRAAMARADLVLVPCVPGEESLDGYGDMRTVAHALRPDVRVRAVLVLAHTRSRILRWSAAQLQAAYPDGLYADIVVPHEMAAAESGTLHLPVTLAAPRSRSAAAYRALARAVAADLALSVHVAEPEA